MPDIYSPYTKKNTPINEFEDFFNLPALVKDTGTHSIGFREKVKLNPYILLPKDTSSATVVYKSGGTRGTATPTFLTTWDHEVEALSLKKCFEYMGIKKDVVALNSYNPTHKGGQLITNALLALGVKVIPRRTTDTPTEMINTIKTYGVSMLATVQGPLSEDDNVRKGAGIDFLSLIEAGQDVLEQHLDLLFITGYSLIPEVIAWSESNKKNLATCLGSSEAIPQATSTVKGTKCKYNNLHLINGPHYLEIVKLESGTLVPVKRGETGLLLYTTIARDGTIYIRYAPGDAATLTAYGGECDCGIRTPIISNIRRIDIPEDTIAAGCCIG